MVYPGIVLRPIRETLLVDLRREQLGQRGFDSAGILAIAIVIENALHPGASHGSIRAIGQNGGILDRDVDLIVEAIRHPAANLLRRRGTGIHHHIEGMMNVVGPPLGSQLRLEFLPAPGSEAHRTISMPSHATSPPRRDSSADSAGGPSG